MARDNAVDTGSAADAAEAPALDAEFEKAFDEEVAKTATGAPAGGQGDGDEGHDQDATGDKAPATGESPDQNDKDDEQPAEGSASADQDAAHDKDSEATGADGGKAASAAKDFDWDKATPEERKAAFDALQRDVSTLRDSDKSNRGRIAALARIRNVSQQLAAMPAGSTGRTKVNEQLQKLISSDRFKKFEEEYGDIAAPFRDLTNAVSNIVGEVAQGQAQATVRTREQLLDEASAYVVSHHKDWNERVQDPEWKQWQTTLSRKDREALARNATEVVDGEEAVELMDDYKAWKSAQRSSSGGEPESPKPAKGDPKPAGSGEQGTDGHGSNRPGGNIAERRRQSGLSVVSRGAGAASGPPDDFDKAFDFEVEKSERKRREQRAASRR